MGIPEEDGRHFERGFQKGGVPGDTRGDSETWRGSERRYHDDQNSLGPNRRMVER
jgi:hypothetical protein